MATALVILAPGFEEIEAVTIIDLLRRGGVDVTVAGLDRNMVVGSHGIAVKPDIYYEEVDGLACDMLILPGGQPGTDNMKSNPTLIQWIQRRQQSGQWIAAICAAPSVLYAAGITDQVKLTSYPSEAHLFREEQYQEDPVVVDGNIITSRGVGTAIDFSLTLVGLLVNEPAAKELSKHILHG
jgi:protein deglycase